MSNVLSMENCPVTVLSYCHMGSIRWMKGFIYLFFKIQYYGWIMFCYDIRPNSDGHRERWEMTSSGFFLIFSSFIHFRTWNFHILWKNSVFLLSLSEKPSNFMKKEKKKLHQCIFDRYLLGILFKIFKHSVYSWNIMKSWVFVLNSIWLRYKIVYKRSIFFLFFLEFYANTLYFIVYLS